MRNRKNAAALWDAYAHCVPDDSPDRERKFTKRAFYSGVYAAMFDLIRSWPPELSLNKEDTEYMAELKKEYDQFQSDVKSGRR